MPTSAALYSVCILDLPPRPALARIGEIAIYSRYLFQAEFAVPVGIQRIEQLIVAAVAVTEISGPTVRREIADPGEVCTRDGFVRGDAVCRQVIPID